MAAWTTFASRFASFEVPAAWTLAPGLGALENRDKGLRRSVVLAENWPDPAVTARAYAEKQQQMLQQQVKGVEVIKSEALADRRFEDAWLSVLRTAAPDGERFLQRQLTAVCGNLVISLTFSGLERDVREWAEACERAEKSLSVTGSDRIRALRRESLLPQGGAVGPVAGSTPLPFQHVNVPALPGWQVDPGAGTMRRGDASITVTNHGFGGKSPDQLFGDALARTVKDQGRSPRRWDTDRPAAGTRFALEVEVADPRSTWTRTEGRIERTAFVDENGVILELGVACPAKDTEALAAFGAVVQGHAPLEPEARRLRPVEPWLPVELTGPWTATAPGLYMRMAHPVLILGLQRFPAPQGLAKLAATMKQALRGQPELACVTREESAEGSFKGRRAIRHTLDCLTKEDKPLAFRTAWLEVGQEACSVELRGEDPAGTEELFLQLLEGIDPKALRSTGGGR